MTKNKGLLILLLIIFIIFLYLIITSEQVNINVVKEDKTNIISPIELKNNYQNAVPKILDEYASIINKESFVLEEIADVKNKLLDLKVPQEYKELHLSLVLALTEMENFLITEIPESKQKSQQYITQAKNNYNWLKI